MTTLIQERPETTSAAPPTGTTDRVLDALAQVDLDVDTWTAHIGPRTVTGDSVRELRPRLVAALYEVLHTGREEEKDLGRIVREGDVERLLAPAVPHEHAPRAGRVLDRGEDDAVVDLGEARVRVPAEMLPEEYEVGEVVRLRVPAARPALSHGFFLIDSPLGMGPRADGTRRVYVHATDPESAASAWRVMLTHLNDTNVPYRSKTLSHRDGYPRRDSIVVYLPRQHAGAVPELAATVAGMPGIADSVSTFARKVAPGVGEADDPADTRSQYGELSFGEHRCAVAVNALIRVAEEPGRDLATELRAECRLANVDPDDMAFNAAG